MYICITLYVNIYLWGNGRYQVNSEDVVGGGVVAERLFVTWINPQVLDVNFKIRMSCYNVDY